MFRDRVEAGERLGVALAERGSGTDLVLGIPRGGVIVAARVARALGVPLDVVVPRKLGAPFNPELAIGAVAPGVRVLDDSLIRRLGVDIAYLEEQVRRQEQEIDRRTRAYRGDRPPRELTAHAVVIVDDGVATGATAIASLRWARRQGAHPIVFAVPVGPPSTIERLAGECDDVIVLEAPHAFYAVGEWYGEFDQVTDEEVVAAIASGAD